MADATKIAGSRNRAVQIRNRRRDGFTAQARQTFLDTLAATCNVTASAKAAGVTVATCYWQRKRIPEFALAWQEALSIGYERLEAALLEYVIARVATDRIDPTAADPTAIKDSVVTALENRTVSIAELQFALMLLNRHEAGAQGRAVSRKGTKRASAAETDAALTRKLDALARQMASHGR
ncbi:hypothetical protein ACFO8O_01735 [Hephaestia sp. GCM10023244]|uniref:hypothetical protein n=1 Tax=unclassified Hephaestia TaxID=2631281 RepID=UPI0020772FAE|nr:hypothetical protein [Hephaestia sp. MAHUQ-44]MCM8729692.1 hypothetical protein [Hephaestia sp. MAHUQ-44]